MNNDIFKKFVAPFVDEMIEALGGAARARDLHAQLPDAIIHFVAGGVFGLVAKAGFRFAGWRSSVEADVAYMESIHADRRVVVLNQEEIRRVLDLVRLRLETESTTS